jgi:phage antirepressor YoqD-like protein
VTDTFTLQQAARLLNVGTRSLFEQLRREHILDENNLPYGRYTAAGYFQVRTTYYTNGTGDHARGRTLVTVKGLQWLEQKLTSGRRGHDEPYQSTRA